MDPFATSLALYLFTVPFWFSFTLKTHLHPIAFLLGGRSTKEQVPLLNNAICSSLIADFQCSCCRASHIEIGSFAAKYTLGLNIPDFDLVCTVCVLTG